MGDLVRALPHGKPSLDRLQGARGNADFSVVAVNIDTARLDGPKAFLKEIGAKNLSLYADSSANIFETLKQDGKVLGLPTTILVAKDGCDIGTMAGPAKWDSPDALARSAPCRPPTDRSPKASSHA